MEEKLDNVNGVGQQMGIAIGFLKEQRKTLNRMEEKLDTIMENLK
jgi:hypothetical protein